MNKVILIGRATRDIELRTTQGGISTCSFTIAVDRPKNRDGVRNADFPQIVAWRKTAEVCAQYVHKGDRVAVEGKIQTRNYEKDGQKVYVTEVLADNVELLSPRNQQAAAPGQEYPTPAGGDEFVEVDDSNIPF